MVAHATTAKVKYDLFAQLHLETGGEGGLWGTPADPMDEAELTLWRIERLLAAIDRVADGNKTAFARRFGYADGAFIRQMVKGKRPIGEKLIRKIEAEPGMTAWFSDTAPVDLGPLQSQVRTEVANREIPEHVLKSVLDLLRGFPEKTRKIA